MSAADICTALRARAFAAAPGAALPPANVALENAKFTPPADRYWRIFFLPGVPRAAAIGSDAPNRHVGLLQIDIMDPKDKQDGATAQEADRIAAAYKRGTVLTHNGVSVVCEKAYAVRPMQDDPARFRMIVRIEWRADVSN